MNASPKDPPIRLKNPVVAAILAFLVPGAGHLYQGRIFKGVIYLVCILTMFIWGMQIGHWQLLFRLQPSNAYLQDEFLQEAEFDRFRDRLELRAPSRLYAKTHWGYFAQVPVGLFSIPAFIQEERYYSNDNTRATAESLQIEEPVEALLAYFDRDDGYRTLSLIGQLEIAPEQSEFGLVRGTFRGESEDGKDVVIELAGEAVIDAPIGSAPYRELRVSATHINDEELDDAVLIAKTHRPWLNSFLVPPDYANLEALHYQLGKKYTLAQVFTWIAGLLNVLAIWDAYAGPAYGYRLPIRSEEDGRSNKKNGDNSDKEPEPSPAASGTA